MSSKFLIVAITLTVALSTGSGSALSAEAKAEWKFLGKNDTYEVYFNPLSRKSQKGDDMVVMDFMMTSDTAFEMNGHKVKSVIDTTVLGCNEWTTYTWHMDGYSEPFLKGKKTILTKDGEEKNSVKFFRNKPRDMTRIGYKKLEVGCKK